MSSRDTRHLDVVVGVHGHGIFGVGLVGTEVLYYRGKNCDSHFALFCLRSKVDGFENGVERRPEVAPSRARSEENLGHVQINPLYSVRCI